MATKTPVFELTVTDLHIWLEGKVRAVHVIPLVDEAAAAEKVTATKTPVVLLAVTENHLELEGNVTVVHVIPSVE
jgi:hypothetical protein